MRYSSFCRVVLRFNVKAKVKLRLKFQIQGNGKVERATQGQHKGKIEIAFTVLHTRATDVKAFRSEVARLAGDHVEEKTCERAARHYKIAGRAPQWTVIGHPNFEPKSDLFILHIRTVRSKINRSAVVWCCGRVGGWLFVVVFEPSGVILGLRSDV